MLTMNSSTTHLARHLAAVLVASWMIAIVLVPTATQAKNQEILESYTANVMVMDAPGQANSSVLTMNIYGWTSDEDRDKVVEAIKEATDDKYGRSTRGVSTTLRKLGKAGYLFLAGKQGWPIRYARELETDSGKQIVLALDRPVTFSEVYAGSQAQDFDVSLIVLKLDASGNGEGIASVGTELSWDETKDQLEVTNFSSQPVKLTSVRPGKK
jgi:hypothetical protein